MTQQGGYAELLRLSLGVEDPRHDRGKRYQLCEVLFLIVVGLLAGCNDAEAIASFGRLRLDWFRRFLVLEHGVPSHDTILYILALVPPAEVETLVRVWTTALRQPGALTVDGGHIACDGQALRGSVDRRAGTSPVHIVSAYLTGLGVTLGSVRVDDKSNEITAIPDLIKSLDVRGATVTIDAMGCQRAIAAALREAEANYVLQVKENQPKLLEALKGEAVRQGGRRQPGAGPSQVERHRELDKGHGRLENRMCMVSHDISALECRGDWADLAGFATILRERENLVTGKKSQEISYFIFSDRGATAARIAALVRNHWGIENGLHWTLDVVWGSDGHQVRDRRAAENLAYLRRFAAGMVKQSVGERMSGKRLRDICGWDPDVALQVLRCDVISRPAARRPNRKSVGRFGMGVDAAKKRSVPKA